MVNRKQKKQLEVENFSNTNHRDIVMRSILLTILPVDGGFTAH